VGDPTFWVRTELGKLWGPLKISALEGLRGQLTVRSEASLDGKEFRPAAQFPELRGLLPSGEPAIIDDGDFILELEPPPPPRSPRPFRPSSPQPALRAEAEGAEPGPAASSAPVAPRPAASPTPRPAVSSPAAIAAPAPVAPAPVAPAPVAPAPARPPPPASPPSAGERAGALPESGDLAETSPVRLYAMAAAASATGWLQLELDKGHLLQLSFRRGTPEHLSSDDPELSLLRFLQSRGLVTGEQGLRAEEQATKTGQDLVSVLFQLQLIPPSDAHRLLGDYSLSLLDRALLTWRGKFSFEADAPAPPGAFPLGQRWTLLAEAVRRLDPTPLRARLGKRLLRPVLRSGGLAVGQVEQLALNAQEARLYASIDGTRTGEELLKLHDPAATLRMLYLLTELGHLGFGELIEAPAPWVDPAPILATPSGGTAPVPKADGAPPAVRELPRIARPPPPGTAGGPSRPPPSLQAQPTAGAPAAAPRPPAPAAPPPAAKPSAAPPPATRPSAAPPPATRPSAAPPPAMRPPPAFAVSPPNETPAAMLARLQALLLRLEKADHFAALGLDRKAMVPGEAKRNFFVLAKELHPDTVSDPAQTELHEVKAQLFGRINEASQVLADDARRKAYEEELDGLASNVDIGRIFAAEENFQRAEIMIKARKYADGLALLEDAIRLNADEAEFYAWRGYARFLIAKDRKAAFPDASADCCKAIRMIDKCLPAHLFLGHMAKAMGDLPLAEQCYQHVLQIEPRHVEAQRELRLMGKK
jgi:hypothetical protein